jgi:hypothetical protein
VLASYANSLTMLYLTYGLIGGLGTGIVYVGVVGQIVGWFPERRGDHGGPADGGAGDRGIEAVAGAASAADNRCWPRRTAGGPAVNENSGRTQSTAVTEGGRDGTRRRLALKPECGDSADQGQVYSRP